MATKGMTSMYMSSTTSMTTELLPNTTRTCSKHHGKIAKDNSFTDFENKLNMTATTTSRHVCKLVQLISKHIMACEYNQQQEDMFMKLLMARTWS